PDAIENPQSQIANSQSQIENPKSQIFLSVPLSQVEQVVIFGNVGLTTPAMNAFLTQNTEVVFLSQRGEYRGRLIGQATPHVPVRRAQYRAIEKPAFALEMAKHFVRAKIQHQKAFLLRNTRQERPAAVDEAVTRLQAALEELEHKTTLESTRGLEGASTAAYFGGLRAFFTQEWGFDGRNRRPPRDPVNVLLSFGYTLLTQSVTAAVETAGLDPYAGFLHEYVYNRPALALDLMEEFRPVIDGLVLWACRSGLLTPGGDFFPGDAERPVILDEDGTRRFLQAYEQRMAQVSLHPVRQERLTLRQCLIEQARQVARAVMEEQPVFIPMGYR
ncbi:MAG: CRISPR-associated endonuclease Cas1, partial [Anaerolineales bacterium]